ncbi:MAG: hypothetical protein R2825_14395 [Saprospiraceae bacterium]
MSENFNTNLIVDPPGPVKVKLFTVTNDQLIILEKIEKGSLMLRIALFLLGIAISQTISFYNLPQGADATLAIVFMSIGYSGGIVALIGWALSKSIAKEVIREIRNQPGNVADGSEKEKPGASQNGKSTKKQTASKKAESPA